MVLKKDKEIKLSESIVLEDLKKYSMHQSNYPKLNKLLNFFEYLSSKSILIIMAISFICLLIEYSYPNFNIVNSYMGHISKIDIAVILFFSYHILNLSFILIRNLIILFAGFIYKDDFLNAVDIELKEVQLVFDKISLINKDGVTEDREKIYKFINKRNFLESTLQYGVNKKIISLLLNIEMKEKIKSILNEKQ